jgi:hypothetical protein
VSDCILSKNQPQKDGYCYETREGKRQASHRWEWEDSYGKIPKGLVICHKCDNPSCKNLDHLFMGTNADNQRDKRLKGRACRGETRHNAKLNKKLVRWIRDSKESQRVLALLIGVDPATVRRARQRITWAHVT